MFKRQKKNVWDIEHNISHCKPDFTGRPESYNNQIKEEHGKESNKHNLYKPNNHKNTIYYRYQNSMRTYNRFRRLQTSVNYLHIRKNSPILCLFLKNTDKGIVIINRFIMLNIFGIHWLSSHYFCRLKV